MGLQLRNHTLNVLMALICCVNFRFITFNIIKMPKTFEGYAGLIEKLLK